MPCFSNFAASSPSHWAHNWIVGAVTLRLPRWPLMRWVLPVVFCLYRKPADGDRRHPFHTRQVLAAQMVCQVAEALPGVQIRVAAEFIHHLKTGDAVHPTRDMMYNLEVMAILDAGLRSARTGKLETVDSAAWRIG